MSASLKLALPGERVVGDCQLHLPQALDLVSEPRGLFEFEVRRRGAHALLHVGDDAFDIVADERLVALAETGPGIDQNVVALIDRGHDVADVLLDALRA